MSPTFIVAPNRCLGVGINANPAGTVIPLGCETVTDVETGMLVQMSEAEARALVATGFGRIEGELAAPAIAEPAGLVRGPGRVPVSTPMPTQTAGS